ncbi:MAG: prephenate dehydratase [Micromonosporaceae bacterium]|nr:prephenate dehydratase [Micromonosporaceae bacterium]
MPGVPPTRFTYLGPEGTFSEQALRRIPAAKRAELRPARSVPDALDAVRDADADAALVPLENSVEGAVGVTLDQLAEGDPLVITREVVLPVTFVLATRVGRGLDEIRTVASHPHATAQCRDWLHKNLPQAAIVDVLSTAAAAAAVAKGEHDAAICAPIAVERHRLNPVAEDIGDHPDAVTRFVLVSRVGAPPAPTSNDVTSIVVYIAHDRVGSLLGVLTELAVRGINLTRIESRPVNNRLGQYCFFLDCTGHVADARMGEALMGLRRTSAAVRFLGSYPRASPEKITAPPGTADADFSDAVAWLSRLRHGGVE